MPGVSCGSNLRIRGGFSPAPPTPDRGGPRAARSPRAWTPSAGRTCTSSATPRGALGLMPPAPRAHAAGTPRSSCYHQPCGPVLHRTLTRVPQDPSLCAQPPCVRPTPRMTRAVYRVAVHAIVMQHAGFSHHGFLYWRAKIGVHDCGANRRTSITRELRIAPLWPIKLLMGCPGLRDPAPREEIA
jgi:hypothetical protein